MRALRSICLFFVIENFMTALQKILVSSEELKVGLHHLATQFFNCVLRHPAQFFARLAGITHKQVYFCGPEIFWSYFNQRFAAGCVNAFFLFIFSLPAELDAHFRKCQIDEVTP